jgi:hypothetical protein
MMDQLYSINWRLGSGKLVLVSGDYESIYSLANIFEKIKRYYKVYGIETGYIKRPDYAFIYWTNPLDFLRKS